MADEPKSSDDEGQGKKKGRRLSQGHPKQPEGKPQSKNEPHELEDETSTADLPEQSDDEADDEADDAHSDYGSQSGDTEAPSVQSSQSVYPSFKPGPYELRPLQQPSLGNILDSNTKESIGEKDITDDKLLILENAKKAARQISAQDKGFKDYENSSDSQDCMTCFRFKKQKKSFKEILKEEGASKFGRWLVKWLVFFIGLGNFIQSVHDSFNLLQFQMKFDYFFALGVYNCKEWTVEAYKGLLFVYTAHGLTSVILLFGNSKSTATFTLYWVATQVLLSATNILEGFFKFRFSTQDEMILYLIYNSLLTLLDIIEIAIVLLRFYLLDRPYQLRLKRLAASARLDRTLNRELFLRASMFLQRKSAIREAANFQILAVIKKLREEYNTTGMKAPPDVVTREVDEALSALRDQSKYPGLKQLKEAAKARRRMSDVPRIRKPPKVPKPTVEDRRASLLGMAKSTADLIRRPTRL